MSVFLEWWTLSARPLYLEAIMIQHVLVSLDRGIFEKMIQLVQEFKLDEGHGKRMFVRGPRGTGLLFFVSTPVLAFDRWGQNNEQEVMAILLLGAAVALSSRLLIIMDLVPIQIIQCDRRSSWSPRSSRINRA